MTLPILLQLPCAETPGRPLLLLLPRPVNCTQKKKTTTRYRHKNTVEQRHIHTNIQQAASRHVVATLLLFSPYRCSRLLDAFRQRERERANRFGFLCTSVKGTDKVCMHTLTLRFVERRTSDDAELLDEFHSIYK